MNNEDEYDNIERSFSQAIDRAVRDLWGKPKRLLEPAMTTVLLAYLLSSIKDQPNELQQEWTKIALDNLQGLQLEGGSSTSIKESPIPSSEELHDDKLMEAELHDFDTILSSEELHDFDNLMGQGYARSTPRQTDMVAVPGDANRPINLSAWLSERVSDARAKMDVGRPRDAAPARLRTAGARMRASCRWLTACRNHCRSPRVSHPCARRRSESSSAHQSSLARLKGTPQMKKDLNRARKPKPLRRTAARSFSVATDWRRAIYHHGRLVSDPNVSDKEARAALRQFRREIDS